MSGGGKRLVVGISGASGTQYGVRELRGMADVSYSTAEIYARPEPLTASFAGNGRA
jgi:3-polyprenyl-4-hydroxybenzoate decarboxylase